MEPPLTRTIKGRDDMNHLTKVFREFGLSAAKAREQARMAREYFGKACQTCGKLEDKAQDVSLSRCPKCYKIGRTVLYCSR